MSYGSLSLSMCMSHVLWRLLFSQPPLCADHRSALGMLRCQHAGTQHSAVYTPAHHTRNHGSPPHTGHGKSRFARLTTSVSVTRSLTPPQAQFPCIPTEVALRQRRRARRVRRADHAAPPRDCTDTCSHRAPPTPQTAPHRAGCSQDALDRRRPQPPTSLSRAAVAAQHRPRTGLPARSRSHSSTSPHELSTSPRPCLR